MKKATLLATFLLCTSLFLPALAKKTNSDTGNGTQTSYLFVLAAENGVVKKNQLILENASKKIVYFTDRPVRKAGVQPLRNFLKAWDEGSDSFEKDPPNVTLTHDQANFDSSGAPQAIPVELSHPVYKGDTLTFTLKSLTNKLNEGNYNHMYLFIDGYNSPCWEPGSRYAPCPE